MKQFEDIISKYTEPGEYNGVVVPYLNAIELCKEIYNNALDLAIENAEVKWVDNPKMSDKNHQTAIVDIESIEKLKIQ